MIRIPNTAICLLLAVALAGCGLTGDLQRPGPLFGDPFEEIVPAELPEVRDRDLPQLPARQDGSGEDDATDELLGGPEQG